MKKELNNRPRNVNWCLNRFTHTPIGIQNKSIKFKIDARIIQARATSCFNKNRMGLNHLCASHKPSYLPPLTQKRSRFLHHHETDLTFRVCFFSGYNDADGCKDSRTWRRKRSCLERWGFDDLPGCFAEERNPEKKGRFGRLLFNTEKFLSLGTQNWAQSGLSLSHPDCMRLGSSRIKFYETFSSYLVSR